MKPYVAIKALLTIMIPTDVTILNVHAATSMTFLFSSLLARDICIPLPPKCQDAPSINLQKQFRIQVPQVDKFRFLAYREISKTSKIIVSCIHYHMQKITKGKPNSMTQRLNSELAMSYVLITTRTFLYKK